ncbi:ABC transporter substrate binding component [Caballeronia cordobensis]|uniref:ABC transporter substrate binding component n=1 Tax=Caballeronia cordobensis TaxID=1353886 RepID=A0A158GRF4_CABCO|nr:transporter substrate-binding domain-containing protein [Caballeronia cordobensis]SAL34622.1 ABC transporter substrate binding component [Caballeronia cordobensis]
MKAHSIGNLGICAGVMFALLSGNAIADECKPAHTFSSVTPGTLTIVAHEYMPFSGKSGDDAIKGIDGDIIKAIAAKECLKLNVSIVDAAAVIQSVSTGKADFGIGDWQRTVARSKVLGLSGPLYTDQMGVISADGVDTIPALQGKKVGVVAGSYWNADLKKYLGSSLTIYPNPVALAQDLSAKRIDIGIDSYLTAAYNQKTAGYRGFKVLPIRPDASVPASLSPSQAGFPYQKSNGALGDAITADIAEMHKAGDIARIIQSYDLQPSAADVGEPRLVQ